VCATTAKTIGSQMFLESSGIVAAEVCAKMKKVKSA
jgi:hypothetical protein